MVWKFITLRLHLVQICLWWDLKMLSVEKIIRFRNIALGLTSVIYLLYALLVILTRRPGPMPWWLPGMFGLLSGVIIFLTFWRAGPILAQQVSDQLSKHLSDKAHRFGYWAVLLLYPVFGFLIAADLIPLSLSFPIMGTLTGAAYLLSFVILSEWPDAGWVVK